MCNGESLNIQEDREGTPYLNLGYQDVGLALKLMLREEKVLKSSVQLLMLHY